MLTSRERSRDPHPRVHVADDPDAVPRRLRDHRVVHLGRDVRRQFDEVVPGIRHLLDRRACLIRGADDAGIGALRADELRARHPELGSQQAALLDPGAEHEVLGRADHQPDRGHAVRDHDAELVAGERVGSFVVRVEVHVHVGQARHEVLAAPIDPPRASWHAHGRGAADGFDPAVADHHGGIAQHAVWRRHRDHRHVGHGQDAGGERAARPGWLVGWRCEAGGDEEGSAGR